MIPDFPFVKLKLDKYVNQHLRSMVKGHAPSLSFMGRLTLYEGNKSGVIYPDGRHVVKEFTTVHAEFSIENKDLPKLEANDFISKVSDSAKTIADQMEKGIFSAIDEAVTESGNIMSGGMVGPDLILSMLDRVQLTFDDDDRMKPNRPGIISSEDVIKKLQEFDVNATPEEKADFQNKEKIILDRKYTEYILDLQSRQIID